MKPCGGCAKRREMIKAALAAARAKLTKAKAPPEPVEKPHAPDADGSPT